MLLPLAIAAMRRQHKVGVVLTLLGFIYVYGLAETGSLTLQPVGTPAARPGCATAPGLAEAAATPEAAAPVDTVVAASTLAAAANALEAPTTPDAAPAAEAGQWTPARPCLPRTAPSATGPTASSASTAPTTSPKATSTPPAARIWSQRSRQNARFPGQAHRRADSAGSGVFAHAEVSVAVASVQLSAVIQPVVS